MMRGTERVLAVWTGIAAVLLGLNSAAHLVLTELRGHSSSREPANVISSTDPAPMGPLTVARSIVKQSPALKNDSLMTTIELLSVSSESRAKTDMEIVAKVDESERHLPKQIIAKTMKVSSPTPAGVQATEDAESTLLLDIDADIMASASMPTAAIAPFNTPNSRVDEIVAGRAEQARDATAHELGRNVNAGLGGLLN